MALVYPFFFPYLASYNIYACFKEVNGKKIYETKLSTSRGET